MTNKIVCSLLMIMLAVVSVNAQPSITRLYRAVDNEENVQKLTSELQKSKYTKLKHEDNYGCQVWAKGCKATYYTRKDGMNSYKFSNPKTANANVVAFRSIDGMRVDGFNLTVFGKSNAQKLVQELKTLGFKKMPIDPTGYYEPRFEPDIVDIWTFVRKGNPEFLVYEYKGGIYVFSYFLV